MIYAIGVESKRHAIYTKGAPLGDEDFRLVEADADGWIPWDGKNVSPVPIDSEFEVWLRGGSKGQGLLGKWVHEKTDLNFDIIAYRPILDAESSEPEAPEWDGEGLPPVGCECDCYHTGTYQGVVTVRYMGSEMCVLLNHDHGEEQCGPIDAYSFRPLRTPAQRAEDEAVEEMIRSAGLDDEEYNRGVCRDLYRAGYRKEA